MNSPIKLSEKLPLLADTTEYEVRGTTLIRWGQQLRTTPVAAALLENARNAGNLIPLSKLARVRSGVVTRANAFFIVQELPFEQIPNRFHLTKRDHASIAVIIDGKNTPHRIGRKYLRNIVKGPEALVGPNELHDTDLRLVAVYETPDRLTELRDNDTKAYLRRGETLNYSVSEDKMKGGIPAERANIKSRKPNWYSFNIPEAPIGRLVVPEHFDQRFIVTALSGAYHDYVVIDTCYVIECHDPAHQPILLASLNSLMTWYQIELRGRTQHGEGVLKVKIPDFSGIMVLDPDKLSSKELTELLEAFKPVSQRKTLVVQEELEQDDRKEFDAVYLRITGIPEKKLDETRQLVARELREAIAERRTRPESVSEFKSQRAPKQRTSRVVDAFASRIVSSIQPYPDPRHAVPSDACFGSVSVMDFDGPVSVGSGLFDSGTVFAGSEAIATTSSAIEAMFVRSVLTIDPQLRSVDVPTHGLDAVIAKWQLDVGSWWKQFLTSFLIVTEQVSDPKTVEAIRKKALELAHASETPAAN